MGLKKQQRKKNFRLARRLARFKSKDSLEIPKTKFDSNYEVALNKIGSSENDATIDFGVDYNSLRPYYKNKTVLPKRFCKAGPKSLRLLASIALMKGSSALTASHLSVGVGQMWSIVWELILVNEMDSPYLFRLFAAFFADQDFVVHCYTKAQRWATTNKVRNEIVVSKTARNRKHRMETLPWNSLGFPECLGHKSFANLVVLDLSSLGQTPIVEDRSLFLKLTSIRSLAFLTCNHIRAIDGSVLQSWIFSMKLGKWPTLRALCLRNTSVKAENLDQLIAASGLQLYYLETSVVPKRLGSWKTTKLPEYLQFETSSKFHYLERHLRPSFLKAGDDSEGIIMDYKIVDDNISAVIQGTCDFDKLNHAIERLWRNRSSRVIHSDTPHYEYVLSTAINSRTGKAPIVDNAVKKRKILQSSDCKAFFDLA